MVAEFVFSIFELNSKYVKSVLQLVDKLLFVKIVWNLFLGKIHNNFS